MSDLRSVLAYTPQELLFGTSGRRGRVVDLTQLEIYINIAGELEYLLSLARDKGGIAKGEEFYFAQDLRPSSSGIARAVVSALEDAGMQAVNMGLIPTPALTSYAVARNRGSLMITGSHIPFDLNGYKLNTSTGEIMKTDEAPIGERVALVRERLYSQSASESAFDRHGALRSAAREEYLERYRSFFPAGALKGKRILAYQHSAVGRDLLVEILQNTGADITPCGRSDTFVAIDTEAIDDAQLATIQALVDESGIDDLWAVVSTDGDSDRPLILGVESGKVRFFPGDLVGMIVAEYLGADAVVVPISCNDAIDRGTLAAALEPKTRIGSPHVIAGMSAARAEGRKAVCGWEANGGFLLGSDVTRNGRTLTALPTRDAILPILGVLYAAAEKRLSLPELFATLPRRFSRAALLRNFPRSSGRKIVEILTGEQRPICRLLEGFFRPEDGFSSISRIDYTDGVRLIFENGEVAHFRPSGNADEFRIYAVADTQARASGIVSLGTAEPDGIIRSLERALIGRGPLSPEL